MTKLGAKRIHPVRTRGGNLKHRALRLESGNFAWASEHTTRKTRIIGVVYNASNNELVRTNTIVKSAIVQIDAAPFRQWYEAHYAQPVTKKGVRVRPPPSFLFFDPQLTNFPARSPRKPPLRMPRRRRSRLTFSACSPSASRRPRSTPSSSRSSRPDASTPPSLPAPASLDARMVTFSRARSWR